MERGLEQLVYTVLRCCNHPNEIMKLQSKEPPCRRATLNLTISHGVRGDAFTARRRRRRHAVNSQRLYATPQSQDTKLRNAQLLYAMRLLVAR